MSLDRIVEVSITKGTKTVSQAGFGVPMILGLHTRFAEKIRFYTSMAGVAADFISSDAEYKAANTMFSQEKKPAKIAIGKRTATAAAQVVTFTPTVANNAVYSVTINGTVHTFTSDGSATDAEIVAGLLALVNAGAQSAYVTATGTTTLIITSDVAGLGFSYESSTNLVGVLSTPNAGVQSDLDDISNVSGGNDWYCLILTSKLKAEILQAAAWIESRKRIFIGSNDDADVLTATAGNVAETLKLLSYANTAFLWSADLNYPAAAWAARVLPDDPGSETWKFKTLVGILPDFLTETQITNLETNNSNYFITEGGVNITIEGKMAGGEFIDNTRFIHWVEARIKENVFSKLINVEKVPYTDNGINIIVSAIDEILKKGVRVGGIADDPAYSITAPKATEVATADRAARLLPDVQFDFRLAGAIHKVKVNGTVSV